VVEFPYPKKSQGGTKTNFAVSLAASFFKSDLYLGLKFLSTQALSRYCHFGVGVSTTLVNVSTGVPPDGVNLPGILFIGPSRYPLYSAFLVRVCHLYMEFVQPLPAKNFEHPFSTDYLANSSCWPSCFTTAVSLHIPRLAGSFNGSTVSLLREICSLLLLGA